MRVEGCGPSFGLQFSGSGLKTWGLGFRIQEGRGGRLPNTLTPPPACGPSTTADRSPSDLGGTVQGFRFNIGSSVLVFRVTEV